MTSDQQPAYSFIQYPYGEEDLIANKKVQIDILSKDVSLPELLDSMEGFIKASGFVINSNQRLDVIEEDSPWQTVEQTNECMSCKLDLHSLEQELLCYVRYIAENTTGGSAENAMQQRDEFITYAHKILAMIGEEI